MQLIVDDGHATSDPDTVAISTLNSRPVAVITLPDTGVTSAPVTLDGTASNDADADVLAYQWSVISQPPGASVTIDDPTASLTSMQGRL